MEQPLISAALARLSGLAIMALGIAGWWCNHHIAATSGRFSIKLCVFAPLAVSAGLLLLLKPGWFGRLRPDSSRGHRLAVYGVIGFMAVGSAIDFFLLKRRQRPQQVPPATVPAMPPSMAPPTFHVPKFPETDPGRH